MSSSEPDIRELTLLADQVFALAERLLDQGATADLPDAAVQRLVAAGTRLYARKIDQEGRDFPPIATPDSATATDVAVLATELLEAVNLNLFDLSMWAGRPRRDAPDPARL